MAISEKVRGSLQTELADIKDQGLLKEERFIHSPQASHIEVEFPRGSAPKRVINLCANNYLGLSSHPDVIKAAHEGLDTRGYGMSSVRFICGTQDIHRTLEQKLTAFLGTEDTVLFPSCMDANAGVFEAVLNDQDVMISDRLVHASIIDGITLCEQKRKTRRDTYKHSDMGHLEEKLQEHQDARIRLIITDGVFSMDGDIAPLDKIVAAGRALRRHDLPRRLARERLHGQDRTRDAGALRRRGQDRHHHDHARQGARRRLRRLRERPARNRRTLSPEGASLSLLQHDAAGDRQRGDQSHRPHLCQHRAARQAREEHRVLAQGTHRGGIRSQGR